MTKKFLKQLFEKNQYEVLSIKFVDDKSYAWVTVRDILEKDNFRRYLICDYDLDKIVKFYRMDAITVRYSLFGLDELFEGKLVL